MVKQKLYHYYYPLNSLDKPHEIKPYEERDYQIEISNQLNSIYDLFDDEDDYEDDEELDEEEENMFSLIIDEDRLDLKFLDKNQRWRTRLFREYCSRLMTLVTAA